MESLPVDPRIARNVTRMERKQETHENVRQESSYAVACRQQASEASQSHTDTRRTGLEMIIVSACCALPTEVHSGGSCESFRTALGSACEWHHVACTSTLLGHLLKRNPIFSSWPRTCRLLRPASESCRHSLCRACKCMQHLATCANSSMHPKKLHRPQAIP